MTTRLLPEMDPDAGLNREETAMLFDREDIDRGMELFNGAAKDIPFAMRTDRETGEAEYRVRDVEAIALDWQGLKRAKRRPPRSTAPTPSSVRFSDEDALDSRVEAVAAAIGLDMGTGKRATEEIKPTPTSTTDDADPFATPTNPAVAARTDSVAKAIGLDLGSPVGTPATDDATTQTITAKSRSRTRLGAPRRWGQR